jgi:hypothetical protein
MLFAWSGREAVEASFFFGAADVAADPADCARVVEGAMSAQDGRLPVLAPQGVAIDQRRAAKAGAKGDHHQVVAITARAVLPLADERRTRIILNRQGEAEEIPRPPFEIDFHRVGVLAEMSQDPSRRRVHDARK